MNTAPSVLFARPSLIEGIARIVDIGTTMQMYNTSKSENAADVQALKQDWQIVGNDLSFSIKNYEQGTKKPE